MWDSAPSSSSVYPAERFALIVDAGTGFRLFLIGSKTEGMLALMLTAFGDNEHERNPGKSCYKRKAATRRDGLLQLSILIHVSKLLRVCFFPNQNAMR